MVEPRHINYKPFAVAFALLALAALILMVVR